MKQSLKRFRIPPHIWVKYSIAIFIAAVAVLIIAFACYESGSYSDGTIIFLTVVALILMILFLIGDILFWRCTRCGAPLKRPIMRNTVKSCYYCGAKFENLKLVKKEKEDL